MLSGAHPFRPSYQSKAGRVPTGRSRHQPRQSQIPSQAVLASNGFPNILSQTKTWWISSSLTDQEASPPWSQPLNVSVSSLIPFLDSIFLLPFLSHRNHLYTIDPVSLYSDF